MAAAAIQQQSQQSPASLSRLPDDMLWYIISYLPSYQSKRSLRCTCHLLRARLSPSALWATQRSITILVRRRRQPTTIGERVNEFVNYIQI